MSAENDAPFNRAPNPHKLSRADWLLRDRQGWSREPMLGRDGWWYRKSVQGICLCWPGQKITGMAVFNEAQFPDYAEDDLRWEEWVFKVETDTDVRIAYAIAEEPECDVCGYERIAADGVIQAQADAFAARWRVAQRRREAVERRR
jgi:hypothetical protein